MKKYDDMNWGRGGQNRNNFSASASSRSDNWEDLAAMLQEKANKRLDDANLLVSRASLIIAAIVVIVPCILEQELNLFSFILVTIFTILSFIRTGSNTPQLAARVIT